MNVTSRGVEHVTGPIVPKATHSVECMCGFKADAVATSSEEATDQMRKRHRCHQVSFRVIKLAVAIVVALITSAAYADGPVVKQSTCTATWTAPQTNTDGSNLADLKEYRIYYSPGITVPPTVTAPFAVVPAPELDPPAGRQGTWPCKTLPIGQGAVTVTAVDTAGNESARSAVFPFILADDVSPQPPTNLLIGP